MLMSSQRTNLRRQLGVGIIEVLVAMLILSIGLLSMAALQMRTLRNNESALERSIAVAETHAVADAMRADRDNAKNGQFNLALTDPRPTGTTFRETVLGAWRDNLISGLGLDATGSVNCNGTRCLIVIRWDDSRGTRTTTASPTPLSISTEVQL
jgi:type IV pilus assembly protein PilV